MTRNSTNANPNPSRDVLKLIGYWSVALIPLLWGIIMTINKAMALFY
jgi:hypothetical protein